MLVHANGRVGVNVATRLPCAPLYYPVSLEGLRHLADQNFHKADKTLRKAIALEPGKPTAYFNLGAALGNSGRCAEAAQLYLQAVARYREGSANWADSIARAFDVLTPPRPNEALLQRPG